jgi:hypothetical protein
MLKQAKKPARRRQSRPASASSPRLSLALAMIGQTVDLLASAGTIVHGVVSTVLADSSTPRVVVNGSSYELSQVLTVTPSYLN